MKDFELLLVYKTLWSQGGEGTVRETENIRMAKTVYKRGGCNAPRQ